MAQFLYALISSNINRFSKYFTVRIRRKRVIILSRLSLKCGETEIFSDSIITNKTRAQCLHGGNGAFVLRAVKTISIVSA